MLDPPGNFHPVGILLRGFVFYFKFNIGDYTSHTQHLTLIEDIAYRRLLEAYYLSERPLNSGIGSIARQIRMREHEKEVGDVLHEFFTLSEMGWSNVRADREIEGYHAKSEQSSKAGKASAKSRMSKKQTTVEQPLNDRFDFVEPTTKQEPLNTKQETRRNTSNTAPPEGVALPVWQDFLKTRKTKITDTALNGIRREAEKAGITLENALQTCCTRGWQSFRADWEIDKHQARASPTGETAYQKSKRELWETATGRNSKPSITEIHDVTALALD